MITPPLYLIERYGPSTGTIAATWEEDTVIVHDQLMQRILDIHGIGVPRGFVCPGSAPQYIYRNCENKALFARAFVQLFCQRGRGDYCWVDEEERQRRVEDSQESIADFVYRIHMMGRN